MTTTNLRKLKRHTAFKFSPFGDTYIRYPYDYSKRMYLVVDYYLPVCRTYCKGDTIVYVDSSFNDDLPF